MHTVDLLPFHILVCIGKLRLPDYKTGYKGAECPFKVQNGHYNLRQYGS